MAHPNRTIDDLPDHRSPTSELGDFKEPLSTIQLALRDALEVPSAFLTLSARADREKPASLLAGLVDEYRVLARERGVALRLALSTALPALHVDRQRLARALATIVGSAIRATPPGGVVTVTAASRSGEVVFTIRDSGVGDGSIVRIAVAAPPDD